ncbi:MAG: M23 family metallopeptidase [bacterium]
MNQKKINSISYIYLFISVVITISLYISLCLTDIPISSPHHDAHDNVDPIVIDKNKKHNSKIIEACIESKPFASNFISHTGILSKGENLYLSLKKNNIHSKTIHFIASKMSPVFNFRKRSRPGDSYEIIQDANKYLISFHYKINPTESYILKRNENNTWDTKRQSVQLDKYWERISGEIDGALFYSFSNIPGGELIAAQFANIFAWTIDFHHESRNGDTFSLVVEKFFHGDTFIRYGNILAAQYDGHYTGKLMAYYFDNEYYSPEGRSLVQPFLRAPLNYKYISSGYTHRRLHPILKRIRPHPAIDFAAPTGTPIWAVADGNVIKKKYDRYNGNQIVLRHKNGYLSYYNHCSSFAKNIYVGAQVKQKQTIAYVGTTGLSTGPHLDYRLKKNGKNVNPLTIKFPKGGKLPKTKLSKFNQCVEEMRLVLHGEKDYNGVIIASIDSANL